VAKVKRAIADYRKAIGRAEGTAELCIHYCEEAARLVGDCEVQSFLLQRDRQN